MNTVLIKQWHLSRASQIPTPIRPRGAYMVLALLAALPLILGLPGCAVYLAGKQPGKKDLSVFDHGTPRDHVIAELGPPQFTEERDDHMIDVFKFKQGYSGPVRAGRAVFHATADILTYGLWEIAGTYLEANLLNGSDVAMKVTYDSHQRVRTAELLSGSLSTFGASTDQNEVPFPQIPSSITVVPVLMPQLMTHHPKRLAVTRSSGAVDHAFAAWLDLTLGLLCKGHPDMVLVERDGLEPITNELVLQHSGRVGDDTTVHIGRWLGADTQLAYQIESLAPGKLRSVAESGGELSSSVEIRLIQVESGLSLFRQVATATAQVPPPGRYRIWPGERIERAYREATKAAAAHALAALAATFGDNPLGIVPDLSAQGDSREVLGILRDGPAHLAGLRAGDRIIAVNGQPVTPWTMPVWSSSSFTLERNGKKLDINLLDGNRTPAERVL